MLILRNMGTNLMWIWISNHFLTKGSDNSLQRGPYLVQLCLDLHHICLHFVDASPGEETQSSTESSELLFSDARMRRKNPTKNPTRVKLPVFEKRNHTLSWKLLQSLVLAVSRGVGVTNTRQSCISNCRLKRLPLNKAGKLNSTFTISVF